MLRGCSIPNLSQWENHVFPMAQMYDCPATMGSHLRGTHKAKLVKEK